MKLITVFAPGNNNRVALWEEHPWHPDGEVYIVQGQTVQVAKTPEVKTLIDRGVLVLVETAKDKKEVAALKEEAQEEAEREELGPEPRVPRKVADKASGKAKTADAGATYTSAGGG